MRWCLIHKFGSNNAEGRKNAIEDVLSYGVLLFSRNLMFASLPDSFLVTPLQSIAHMRTKVEGLMKAMNAAKGVDGEAAAAAPAPAAKPAEKGGLFDEDSDDENDNPFKKK